MGHLTGAMDWKRPDCPSVAGPLTRLGHTHALLPCMGDGLLWDDLQETTGTGPEAAICA